MFTPPQQECQAKWSQRERCCSSNSLLIASAFTGRKPLADTDTKHILYSSQCHMTGSGCIYMYVYDTSSYILLSEGIKLRHPVFHLGCTGVGGGDGGTKLISPPFAQMKPCHHMSINSDKCTHWHEILHDTTMRLEVGSASETITHPHT